MSPLRKPFGIWLLAQVDRGDWIDDLAKSARVDPGLPKLGTVDQVRERLQKLGADPDTFGALDDAELNWLSMEACCRSEARLGASQWSAK